MSQTPRAPTILILIAAASGLFRDGLRHILGRREHLRVVATAGAAHEVRGLLASLSPDVAIVDLGTPASHDLVRAVASTRPRTRIVALTPVPSDEALTACAQARVAGYVAANESSDLLVDTIHGVARGELRCSPDAAGLLLDRVAGGVDTRAAARREHALRARLTRREQEVLDLIAEGLSNKQIASRLWIELPTVKNHVHSILRKLEVPSRADAVGSVRATTPVPRGLVPRLRDVVPEPRSKVHGDTPTPVGRI